MDLEPLTMERRMSQKVEVRSGGIGFAGLLALLFIGLKLGGVINWPWLWVLSPLWIPLVLVITIFLAVFTIGFIAFSIRSSNSRRGR